MFSLSCSKHPGGVLDGEDMNSDEPHSVEPPLNIACLTVGNHRCLDLRIGLECFNCRPADKSRWSPWEVRPAGSDDDTMWSATTASLFPIWFFPDHGRKTCRATLDWNRGPLRPASGEAACARGVMGFEWSGLEF